MTMTRVGEYNFPAMALAIDWGWRVIKSHRRYTYHERLLKHLRIRSKWRIIERNIDDTWLVRHVVIAW